MKTTFKMEFTMTGDSIKTKAITDALLAWLNNEPIPVFDALAANACCDAILPGATVGFRVTE